jgi:CheY-like chemotaxis protein
LPPAGRFGTPPARLILLDLNRPEDGREVLANIKRDPA